MDTNCETDDYMYELKDKLNLFAVVLIKEHSFLSKGFETERCV